MIGQRFIWRTVWHETFFMNVLLMKHYYAVKCYATLSSIIFLTSTKVSKICIETSGNLFHLYSTDSLYWRWLFRLNKRFSKASVCLTVTRVAVNSSLAEEKQWSRQYGSKFKLYGLWYVVSRNWRGEFSSSSSKTLTFWSTCRPRNGSEPSLRCQEKFWLV